MVEVTTQGPSSTRTLRVLVLEDNPTDAELILLALRKMDPSVTVEVASNLSAFIQYLQGKPYDVVLADYRLPGCTGLDALQLLREKNEETPFIIVSGWLGDDVAVECIRAGATDYVLKERLARLPAVLERAFSELTLRRGRKEAEAALRESEEKFAMAFRLSPDAMCITTFYGLYVDANQAFLELTGYDREEVLGSSSFDERLWVDPEERSRTVQAVIERERVLGLEAQFRRRSGEVRIAQHSSERIELGGETCILSVIRDITEQKRLEEQLRQSQKMEAIGQLAGGIAHDFNNLLGVIIGHGELLLERDDLPASPRKKVQLIKGAAERAAELTRQLLAFSRKQTLEARALSLNSVVAEAETMLRRLIGENIELITRLEPALSTIKADPGQLVQVIMNLAVNARDAMANGGKLTIETANVEVDESYSRQHLDVKPGPYVLLAITDNGCGMNEATRARIFEPFFTTKEAGKGTGLGLSTVYGIVKQSGGYIWVYSECGRGTTFKIYLPVVVESATPEVRAASTATMPRGQETVLVAEDEAGLRDLLAEILGQNGYNVLLASNPAEALQVAAAGQKIELLVTDVIMPGASGVDLMRQLRVSRPDIKVLYLSGYTKDAIGHHGILEPGMPFLAKPFRPADLACKVREVLDQTPVAAQGEAASAIPSSQPRR